MSSVRNLAIILILASVLGGAGPLQAAAPAKVAPAAQGFAITLADSGEVVLTDADVEAYLQKTNQILLSEEGLRKWESYMTERGRSRLYMRDFVLTIDGAEMYRGHISSMISSMIGRGVRILDALYVRDRRLHVEFNALGDDSLPDPRQRPELIAYFKEQGKLR
jgi:hypothetical protein